jgi:hypothetical protein
MNGQAVTGNIDIQLVEILDEKGMIFLDKPTVANNHLETVNSLTKTTVSQLAIDINNLP